MHRVESARLAAFAHHKPEQIDHERELTYLAAAPIADDAAIVERALKMSHEVNAGQVLS